MMASSLVVRPLKSSEEYDLQFQLSDQAFGEQERTSAESVQRWRRYVTNLPDFRPEQLRGVFRDGEQLGGYMLYERLLRMGAANISTGCISAVVTHPAHRHKGVATAMMQDAIRFARDHDHALLLLNGIPKFYHRFGYTDVIDLAVMEVKLDAVLAQSSSPYTTRLATADDAEGILSLYQRHYYAYTGSFARSLEQQRYRPDSQNWPVLASGPDGEIQGYLANIEGNMGSEMAADNWEAIQALLRHHAQLVKGTDDVTTLRYLVPPTSVMAQLMIEHLEVPDTSHWGNPAMEWAVKSEAYHHRDAGWMARFVHLPALMQAMLPELQERWRRALASWSGTLRLDVGEEVSMLRIDRGELLLGDEPVATAATAHTIQFTPQAFTQLAFGYRPVAWALRSRQNDVAADVIAVLALLFPPGHAWIARSDWF
ncbi:MAG TPA: GNAT family N-acetyltransferase [Ktedonobacteraceae bacterium]